MRQRVSVQVRVRQPRCVRFFPASGFVIPFYQMTIYLSSIQSKYALNMLVFGSHTQNMLP